MDPYNELENEPAPIRYRDQAQRIVSAIPADITRHYDETHLLNLASSFFEQLKIQADIASARNLG